MYYLNCFFVYSILGFIVEGTLGLIMGNGFKSGILNGFWTPVYGIGAVTILFISEYIFKNLHLNKILETIIMFIVVAIVLSFIEGLGGTLIEKLFGKVFWDYSNQKFNIGHYVSLRMALVWGLSSILFVYIIHPLLNGFIKKIPSWITILLVILFIMDSTKTFIENKKDG